MKEELEALIIQNQKSNQEVNDNLEALIVQTQKNDNKDELEAIAKANIDTKNVIKKSNKEIVSTLKELKPDIIQGKTAGDLIATILQLITGKDGYTPEKGKDYFTEDEIKKFKEEVTPKKGEDYVDGKDGDDGYTPIKGEDYFTKDEINEIINRILKEIPKPKDGKDGEDGEDGKDAEIDYEKVLKLVIKKLPKIEKPKEKTIDEFIEDLKGKISFNDLKDLPLTLKQAARDYDFLELKDVPKSYKGSAGKIVKVKVDESGLEFTDDETGTDEKVKYDSEDPTAGYLANKILAGAGITLSEGIGANANKLVITNTDKGSDVDLSGLLKLDQTIPQTTVGTFTFPIIKANSAEITGSLTADNLWYLDGNTLGAKKTLGSKDNQDFGIITNNTERITVLKDGKVGIGTTNPGAKLEVYGVDNGIKVSYDGTKYGTMSADSAGHLVFDSPLHTYFMYGGKLKFYISSYGPAVASNVPFSMGSYENYSIGYNSTTDKLEFITGKIIGTNVKMVIDNTGNVGIGKTTPTARLDITGAGTGTGVVFRTAGSTNSPGITVLDSGKIGNRFSLPVALFQTDTLADAQYADDGSKPTWRLSYSGTPVIDLSMGNSYQAMISNPYSGGSIGGLQFRTGGLDTTFTRMTISKTGKVGIGTTTPNQQLEITKNFRLPATVGTNAYGVIYKDGNRFIHDFNYGDNGTVTTAGQNTFVGLNAGNLTMGSTATSAGQASYNTGIGVQALRNNTTGYQNSAFGMDALRDNTTGSSNSAIGVYALQDNTTGVNNSAIGMQALQNNTTGNNNSAIGMNALRSNTTGYQNSAIGLNALLSNTTGVNNSAIGVQALQNNITGNNNTANGMQALLNNTTGYQNSAIGSNAGRYLSDGTIGRETGNNGLYLGYNSKASANGTDNEIVIGANAIGIGSNTVVLGNDSITKTLLKGEVYFNQSNESVIGINSKGQVYFDTGLSDNVGLIIQGSASQTADLQQFKNVDGDILSSIQSNGGMTFFSNDQDDAGERLILQTKLAGDGTDSAKCLLAFKDINGDSKAWLACHHLSSTGTDHSHFSIEISDAGGPLQSRLIFPYDQDICEAVFNQCNLTLRRNSGQYNGNLNIEGLFNHPEYFRFYPYYATNGDYAFGITLESETHLTLKVFGADDIYFDDHIQMNYGKEIKGIHKTYDGNVLADGIYTLIDGGTTDGTITIKDGLVVAVQKYVP